MQPVPLGATGELYIGGAGLARSYLNRPELTAERFVPNPFGEGRLYKTGDLGRYLADGHILYQGRNDFQVKIRGFRIELGEIEARLLQCEGVREAVVLAREDESGNKRVVAYLTGTPPAAAALRAALAVHLADYMLPAAFVVLDALPLTPNGKHDRKALPAPDALALSSRPFSAPEGEVESAIAAIWQELLKVDRVGRHDHFFELGGHSLLAVQVMSRLRDAFGIDVPLRTLFAHPDLAGFAARLAEAQQTTLGTIEPVDRTTPLPLSWAQQRLWFIDQLDAAAGAAYRMPAALRLDGKLDLAALRATLDRIVARHENLRTTFVMHEGQPVQRIAPAEVGFELAELACDAGQAETLGAAFFAQTFDLAQGPLIRGQLLRLAPDQHVLLIDQHHIISDGWSNGVLTREVSTLYAAFSQGQPDPLAPLAIQYADYAAWQRAWLQGEALQQQAGYWQRRLAGAPELLALPTDRPRPAVQSHAGASVGFTLDADLSAGLKQLGQRHGATLFMTLLAGWGILMSRMSGQEDVVIGTPVANRQRREIEALTGFFVNTLALRMSTAGEPSVAELLAQVKQDTLDAYAHQDIPFEQVVETVHPQRSLAHSPLFQTVLALNNTPGGEALTLPGLRLSSVASQETVTSHFDTALSVIDRGAELIGTLTYGAALYDEASMRRLVRRFESLLRGMVADDTQAIASLDLLVDDERELVTRVFNATVRPYPYERTVHSLFEAEAARRPDAIALVCGAERLSYAELNAHANRLAHRLIAMGAGPDRRIAICAEPGLLMVIGVLAVLKAGAAYVPLDPAYPAQRLAYMLSDSAPIAVLAGASVRQALPESGVPVLALETAIAAGDATGEANPDPRALGLTPQHLAYVIYTSGSTGLPKGTMNHHAGLSNLALAQIELFGIQPDSRVLQFASFSFDASVWELVMALCAGARLVLASRAALMPGEPLISTLAAHGITHLTLPPAALAALPADAALGTLTLVVAGEACPPALAAHWAARTTFFNAYGPTETTVCASVQPVGSEPLPIVPIGRPIANTQMYILDAQMAPVPLGVAGEIHIGGIGVARGYLNRPELTAERFVANPFAPDRLYKTGDLGRWRQDGSIEYLGRKDFQVKIRGFRIELGEIEARLLQCEGVREAVVLAREEPAHGDSGDNKRLVAYLTGTPPAAAALRAALAECLADYMLPAAFVVLDALPLTSNGKVDRKALPAPGLSALATRAYVEPQGDAEHAVAAIWQDLLRVERVGRHDSFFELGGHSLLAVQVVSRIKQALGKEVALRSLFTAPTLSGFTQVIAGDTVAAAAGPLVPIRTEGQRTPLFLIHPGEGEIRYASELTPWLDADTPVYGLVASGFLEGETASASVQEMARHYLQAIRSVQAHGPYQLAGWSAGGTIAYEIANLLIGADETVRFLGLIDTASDYREGWIGTSAYISKEEFLIASLAPALRDTLGDRLRSLGADVPAMLRLCQEAGVFPSGLELDLLERHLSVRHGIAVALRDYALPAIPVPVTLFAAIDTARADTSIGWAAIKGRQLRLIPVPGDHYGLMRGENLQVLGKKLSDALADDTQPLPAPEETRYCPHVLIQRGAPGVTPLFCVPGAGASVTAFAQLGQALGPAIALHGLQPRGLSEELVPYSEIASAAGAYVRAIRQVAPHGRIALLGHSYGGKVVVEMAQQLVDAGTPPAALIVLDSEPPLPRGAHKRHVGRADMLEKLAALFEMNSAGGIGLTARDFAPLSAPDQLRLLLSRLIAAKVIPPRTGIEVLRRIVRVFDSNLNTSHVHDKEYPLPLHMALVSERDDSVEDEEHDNALIAAQWRAHAPQLHVWEAPGNHLTLLSSPHVDPLAEWIKPLL
jgi:amino acid adenylation domain-containing protein